MSVTRAYAVEREQYLEEIDKLVNSHVLHGSESLCKLLRYLAKHVLEHPGLPIKEYQIATEVFGRSTDFDPQLDSMVRVQAGRLRVKLTEYYGSDGVDDPVTVELPKGTYVLAFHHRTAGPARTHGSGIVASAAIAGPRRNWVIATTLLAILLAVCVAEILSLVSSRSPAQAGIARDPEGVPAAFRVFWNGFVSGDEEPWVIFSN